MFGGQYPGGGYFGQGPFDYDLAFPTPPSSVWRNVFTFPEAIGAGPILGFGPTAPNYDDFFFVVGGNNPNGDGWPASEFTYLKRVYWSAGTDGSGPWSEAGTNVLPFRAQGHSVLKHHGAMRLMGGFDPFDGGQTGVYASNITGTVWTPIGNLPAPRSFAVAMSIGNAMFMVGGFDDTLGVSTRTVFRSDDDGATWYQVGLLPISLGGATGVYFNGAMWIFGGWSDELNGESQKVFKSLDLGATWVEVGTNALPYAVEGAAAVVFQNEMWLNGGIALGAYASTTYKSTNGLTWTAGPPLLRGVAYATGYARDDRNSQWLVGGRITSGYSAFVDVLTILPELVTGAIDMAAVLGGDIALAARSSGPIALAARVDDPIDLAAEVL